MVHRVTQPWRFQAPLTMCLGVSSPLSLLPFVSMVPPYGYKPAAAAPDLTSRSRRADGQGTPSKLSPSAFRAVREAKLPPEARPQVVPSV